MIVNHQLVLLEHHVYHFVRLNQRTIQYTSLCILLVPSIEFAQLDEYEQKILSITSNKITLETYLHLTKRCLTQISGHPVREFNRKVFSHHLFYF